MNRIGIQPDARIFEQRMTPEEAQAVVGMWSLQHRLGPHTNVEPTVADLAEGLSITPAEVQALLDQVRGTPAAAIKPKRTKKQDIRLAFMVVIAMVAIIWAGIGFYSMRQSFRSSSAPQIPNESRMTTSGMIVESYTFLYGDRELQAHSVSPDQFAFGKDRSIFWPSTPTNIKPELASIKKALAQVVGGPLGESSSVVTSSVDEGTIERVLAAGPRPYSEGGSFDGRTAAEGRRLIEWKTVKAAYGGKVVEAEVPYARVSQRTLRKKVEAEQSRIIGELAESVLELSKALNGN